MYTKKIKQQLPEDSNQWTMKENVIYGFILFFAQKTPIDQRPPVFLSWSKVKTFPHEASQVKKL